MITRDVEVASRLDAPKLRESPTCGSHTGIQTEDKVTSEAGRIYRIIRLFRVHKCSLTF